MKMEFVSMSKSDNITKLVNVNKESFDIYIGRENITSGYKRSKWANPFKIGEDGTRDEVVSKYETWIKTQPELMNSLYELEGKTLGCWCNSNENCHGKVLLKLLKFSRFFQ